MEMKINLVGYVDADYAADKDNSNSRTGYVFMLCGAPIGLIGSSSSRPYKEFADKPGFWASPAPLHPLQDMWAPQAVPRPYGGPTEHSDSTKRGNLAYGRLTQSEPTCPLEGQVGSGSGGEVPSRGA